MDAVLKNGAKQAATPMQTLSYPATTDYSKLTLSHENILVDKHALVKAFQQASMLLANLFINSICTVCIITHIFILLNPATIPVHPNPPITVLTSNLQFKCALYTL